MTRTGASRVVALVAAHNEEGRIARTVRSIARLGLVDDIVVVDDGSNDATVEQARAAGAHVLAAPRKLGKGAAREQALNRLPPADIYLLIDGDVAETAAESKALLDEVVVGSMDLAVGRLPRLPGGGFGLVKAFTRAVIRACCGLELDEPMSGQRAITRSALAACRPMARRFAVEAAMTIDAARLGFRIGEVPVRMSHRATGRGLRGFAHRGRQGADVLAAALPRLLRIR